MPEGKHNLHLRFAKEFNELAEDFLQWKRPENISSGNSLVWGHRLVAAFETYPRVTLQFTCLPSFLLPPTAALVQYKTSSSFKH